MSLSQSPIGNSTLLLESPLMSSRSSKSISVELGNDECAVFLRETFDRTLLKRYYNELLVPLIPFEDERDSIEKIETGLKRTVEELQSGEYEDKPYVNVCVLVSKRGEIGADFGEVDLFGAIHFEYYCTANVGLINYLLVNEKFRGKGMARKLVARAQYQMELIAKYFGHLAGCNAVFVETNSATKVDPKTDVLPPLVRHKIFHKMGMRLLDFDYVQAPLTPDKSKVNYLLLLVFLSPRIPQTDDIETSYYLPSSLVRNAMKAFWSASSVRHQKDVDFIRMDDQLKRREKVMLLELPWDRPFTIVDLRENVDLELMVTFYEMLADVYGRENLTVLDEWLNTLSTPYPNRISQRVINSKVESHVLLALKYSEHEREHAKPMIAGGISFSYFPSVNCGLIQYTLLPVDGGLRMASSLFDWAIAEIDMSARQRGHLAGANAMFMEVVNEQGDVHSGSFLFGSDLHSVFEQLNWRLVDFDFVSPPQIAEEGTVTRSNQLLLVHITQAIPRFTQVTEAGVEEFSYLNQSIVLNFVSNYWKTAQEGNFTASESEEDEVSWGKMYRKMEEQLERCERIPLRSRPWRRNWMLVDLHEDPDRDLLELFQKKFLDPAGLSSQVDFHGWLRLLELEEEGGEEEGNGKARKKLDSASFEDKNVVDNDFHLLLALDRLGGQKPKVKGKEDLLILAALVFEYDVRTNCGFISHLLSYTYATREDPTDKDDVGSALLTQAMSILEQNAVSRGHLSGCNCIFMEIFREESPSLSPDKPYRIVDFRGRHEWLCSFGCRLLDVDYLPPPTQLRPDINQTKLKYSLGTLLTPRIPKYPVVMNEISYYLPQELVGNFLRTYWENCCTTLNVKPEKYLLFRRMIDLVERRRLIPLLELPWSREWTLVDLYESSDVALLYSFYHSRILWELDGHIGRRRETLAAWVSLLESREEQRINLHIILALEYLSSSSGTRPTVVGGVVSKYFSQINCALVTHLLTSGPEVKRNVMGFSLLEELVENTELNAIEGGMIAGCNSIFMEIDMSASPLVTQAEKKRGKGNGEEQSPFPALIEEEEKQGESYSSTSALVDGGWWLVDFDYFQPPLAVDISTTELKGTKMSLLVLVTQKVPRDQDREPYLTGDTIRSFVQVYWQHSCERVGKSLQFDEDFQRMMKALLAQKRVPLIQLGSLKKVLHFGK